MSQTVPLNSLGLLALADFINQRDIRARVLNLPLMLEEEKDFDVIRFIRETRVRIVAMSLHWYAQLYETLSLSAKIKSALPSLKIVFGGFTASLFHSELLEKFSYVDYIVRGDSEVPLLRLCRFVLSEEGREDSIPNLTWRNGTEIKINSHTYAISQEILDSLRYFKVGLLINSLPMYIRNPLSNFSKDGKRIFYNPGRGCSMNCPFCGGSCSANRLINQRGVVRKSISAVLRDFKDADALDLDYLMMCFDPFPRSHFYQQLFDDARLLNVKFNLSFEAWGLPSAKFCFSLARAFPKPELVITPLTGSERVRKLNGRFFYTNRELFALLDNCNKLDISVRVCLSAGLPFEDDEDFEKTLKLAKYLRHLKTLFSLQIVVGCLNLDPGSPMHLNPGKYRIKHDFTILKSFIGASLEKDFSLRPRYRTHALTEEEIIHRNTMLAEVCDID